MGVERWAISREPDDRLADVRVSLGTKKPFGTYLVFRGDPEEVVELLRKAYAAAKAALPEGHYDDKRGRPQG